MRRAARLGAWQSASRNRIHSPWACSAPALRAWAGERSAVARTTLTPPRACATLALSARISSSPGRNSRRAASAALRRAAAASPANGITTVTDGRLMRRPRREAPVIEAGSRRARSWASSCGVREPGDVQDGRDRQRTRPPASGSRRAMGGQQQVAGDGDTAHDDDQLSEPAPLERHPERPPGEHVHDDRASRRRRRTARCRRRRSRAAARAARAGRRWSPGRPATPGSCVCVTLARPAITRNTTHRPYSAQPSATHGSAR